MFETRFVQRFERLSAAEQRVATFIREHREVALMSSATVLADRTGTSDATVVRTAKALGFSGLAELKRVLAQEMRQHLTLAERVERTLAETGDNPADALALTLGLHEQSIAALRRSVTSDDIRTAVGLIGDARRVAVFGLGPTSAVVNYFVLQMARMGLDALALTNGGLLFADDVARLRAGDLVVAFAYGRLYSELAVLLEAAAQSNVPVILVTDTLGPRLGPRVRLVLTAPRGRADLLSMHATTMVLVEALLIGLAMKRRSATIASLRSLNAARERLAGEATRLRLDEDDT
nr:MurR/RpiR family transcriptional regulator [Acuticoccus mangrovi]